MPIIDALLPIFFVRLAATFIASFQKLSKLYKFRPDCSIELQDISVNDNNRCDLATPLASGIR
jgi:hypothetical protein